jgi:carbonic anhydrase/acetyltransferase-like protein (isoleucine patch superfamily)
MKEKTRSRMMEKKVYIAPDAIVTGDVILGNNVNIWHGAVLRGDSGRITVGEGTNIQDRCVLHEETTLGKNCTVGHGAIVHGCTVGDNTLIGMGALVLTGAVIGNNCIIGAGALVTGKTVAPDGSVLLGSPAKVVKSVTPQQVEENACSAAHYVELAQKAFL